MEVLRTVVLRKYDEEVFVYDDLLRAQHAIEHESFEIVQLNQRYNSLPRINDVSCTYHNVHSHVLQHYGIYGAK